MHGYALARRWTAVWFAACLWLELPTAKKCARAAFSILKGQACREAGRNEEGALRRKRRRGTWRRYVHPPDAPPSIIESWTVSYVIRIQTGT